jgi:hypothetical protein
MLESLRYKATTQLISSLAYIIVAMILITGTDFKTRFFQSTCYYLIGIFTLVKSKELNDQFLNTTKEISDIENKNYSTEQALDLTKED